MHLMTPSWGGDELGEEKQVEENALVHHVRIALRPADWDAPTAESRGAETSLSNNSSESR